MDLMEYRAMKAQEATDSTKGEQPNAQAVQSTTEPIQQTNPETKPGEPTSSTNPLETTPQVEPNPTTSTLPETIDVNGQKVSLEELTKGYLRQSDYTKKTQEVARQAREAQEALAVFNQIKQNPELAEQLQINPLELENQALQQNYYDLMLQQEVSTLSSKYADFEVSEILDFALQHNMENLEDAYLLNKQYKGNVQSSAPSTPNTQAIDVEALKAQIRAELLAEQNTSTIISTNGGAPPTTQATPQLSESEIRVARMMKLSNEDYVKWRDIN